MVLSAVPLQSVQRTRIVGGGGRSGCYRWSKMSKITSLGCHFLKLFTERGYIENLFMPVTIRNNKQSLNKYPFYSLVLTSYCYLLSRLPLGTSDVTSRPYYRPWGQTRRRVAGQADVPAQVPTFTRRHKTNLTVRDEISFPQVPDLSFVISEVVRSSDSHHGPSARQW